MGCRLCPTEIGICVHNYNNLWIIWLVIVQLWLNVMEKLHWIAKYFPRVANFQSWIRSPSLSLPLSLSLLYNIPVRRCCASSSAFRFRPRLQQTIRTLMLSSSPAADNQNINAVVLACSRKSEHLYCCRPRLQQKIRTSILLSSSPAAENQNIYTAVVLACSRLWERYRCWAQHWHYFITKN